MFQNQIKLENGQTLSYTELPLIKGSRKRCCGELDGTPCVIYRKKSYRTVLNYLMNKYSIMEIFDDCKEYSPNVVDCLVDHKCATYFDVTNEDTTHEMVAILDSPLWESAEEDLIYLVNEIHYCRDYEESGGGVFMDDYGLC